MATSLCNERRATLREKGLKILYRGITQYATGITGQELLQSRLHQDILPLCLKGLRGTAGGGGGRSTPAEQYASCRVLEAMSVLLLVVSDGENDDDFVHLIYGPLTRVIKVTQRAVQVRRAALRALTMACFIRSWSSSSSSSVVEGCLDEVKSVMELCEEVGKVEFRGERVDCTLRATAWECWGLLGTLMDDEHLAGDGDDGDMGGGDDDDGNCDDDNDDDDEQEDDEDENRLLGTRGVTILPLLSEYLDTAKDLELRCAIGECVALIHEARLNLGMKKVGDGENASDRRYGKGMLICIQHGIVPDCLIV